MIKLIKRLLGTKKQTSETVDPLSAQAAINEALKKHDHLTKQNRQTRKQALQVLGGTLVGFSIFAAAPANASLNICSRVTRFFTRQFNRQLVEPISQAIEDILNATIDFGMGLIPGFREFMGNAAEKNANVVGSAADSQNHVRQTIADNQVKAASEPPPQICQSDYTASEIVRTQSRAEINTVAANSALRKQTIITHPLGRSRQFEAIARDPQRIRKAMDVSTLIGATPGEDKDITDEYASMDFISITVGPDFSTDELQNVDRYRHAGLQYAVEDAEAIAAQSMSRRQIPTAILSDIRAQRAGNDGDGLLETFKREDMRVYGSDSDGWRGDITDYVDPTPPAIELCLQQAHQNALLVQILLQQKQRNILYGTRLLEFIDISSERQ